MTTHLYTHDICIAHDPGAHHPERPARLEAVLKALDTDEFAALDRREAPEASIEQIVLNHPVHFVEAVLAEVPKEGHVALDPDTAINSASGQAAMRAAGAVCAAVDAVMAGQAKNAFCAVRPPGHHAEEQQSMGFCLFNNVAIGAFHARRVHGAERVAVVDFDVHHGNGTQAAFWYEPDMFFGSTHQFPYYPGTGAASETGESGNIVNCPLSAYSSGTDFRAAMEDRILPALHDFAPDFLFISAGFDAHRDDPLAALNLNEADFAWATEKLLAAAEKHCEGRLVTTLEGGYALDALAASAAAHVRTLMGA